MKVNRILIWLVGVGLLASAAQGQVNRGQVGKSSAQHAFEQIDTYWAPRPEAELYAVTPGVLPNDCPDSDLEDDPWDCLDQVRLWTRVSDHVIHFRASEDPHFEGAYWQPYEHDRTVIPFKLRRELGASKSKRIYFQVRADSNAPLAGIEVAPDERQQAWDRVEDPRETLGTNAQGRTNLASEFREQIGYQGDPYVYSQVVSFDYTLKVVTVASIGDSYASGEGTPNEGGFYYNDAWDSEQCHRSDRNGRRLAVQELRKRMDTTYFIFGDFSCSGAQIYHGLLTEFRGVEGGPPLAPQVDQVKEWLKGLSMPLDVLLISVGGDDIGFATIIESCIHPLNIVGCNNDEKLHKKMKEGSEDPYFLGFAGLEAAYRELNDALRGDQLDPSHILITEYPDLTRDEDGEFGGCGSEAGCHSESQSITGDHLVNDPDWPDPVLGASMMDLHRDESEWVFTEVIIPLNNAVAATEQLGWVYVGGMMEATRAHGIFAPHPDTNPSAGRWFNTIFDSWNTQHDFFGMFHPNPAGYQAYSEQIVAALEPLLREQDIE